MGTNINVQINVLENLSKNYEKYGEQVTHTCRTTSDRVERELESIRRNYSSYSSVTSKAYELQHQLNKTRQTVKALQDRSSELGRRLNHVAREYVQLAKREQQLIRQHKVTVEIPLVASNLSNRVGSRAGLRGIKIGAVHSSVGGAAREVEVRISRVPNTAVQTVVSLGEQIKNKLGSFAQGMVSFFKKTKDAFTDLYGRFAAEIQKCYEKIAAGVKQMVDWLLEKKDLVVDGLKTVGIAVQDTVQFAVDKAKEVGNAAVAFGKQALDMITKKGKEVFSNIEGAISTAAQEVKTSFSRFQDNVVQTVVSAGESIKSKFESFTQGVTSFFNKTKDAFTDLYGRFAAEIQKCYEKIAAGVQQMVDWLLEKKDLVVDGLKTVGIAVKDTVQYAADKAKEVGNAAVAFGKQALDMIKKKGKEVFSNIEGAISTAAQEVKTSFSRFKDNVVQTVVSTGESIKSKFESFTQGVTSFFNKTKDAFTDLYGRFAAEIQKCYEKIAASVQQMVDWIVDNKDKLLNGLKKVGIAVLDTVQFALDILGLIPAIGEIADGLNALIYLLRKDYVNAGLSLAACIPFAGWAATGGKLWVKISKLVNKVDILKVVDRAKEMGSAAINLGQQAIAFITKKGNEVWSRIQHFDVAKKAEDLIAAVKKGHDQLQMKVHAVTEKLNIAFSEWWIRQSQMGIVPPSLSDIFNPKRGKVEGKGIEGTVEGGSTVSKTQAIEKEINDLDEKIANLKLEGNTAELKKLERERRKLANKLNTVDEISDSFVLSGGKEYERKIDNTKNFSHDKGDFGEEVAKIVARDSGLGDDISEMFQVGRNGIDAAFLSKGPPPKLTLIESKASASANFQYSDKQKLGGEAYFQDMLKSKDPRYGDFNRKLKQLKKENPGLIYDYIRVETDVKITRIGFGVDELKVRDWNKKIDGS